MIIKVSAFYLIIKMFFQLANLLTEVFIIAQRNKILDCVSETAAAEMRATYKVGFKDGATMMQEIQD